MQDYVMKKYEEWLEKADDTEVKAALTKMKGDETAIAEAFSKDLEFGTAGMRGTLGAGTNCLNVYTIRKITQGVADCMKSHGYKTASVACDSRINSDLFARTVAEVFAANGIKTYLCRELMPTPYLSFLTRETKSDVGVMITASHNPAKYNGYKVYGSDGCQLTDAAALEMTGYIESVDPFDVKTETAAEYFGRGLIEYDTDEIVGNFLAAVEKQSVCDANGISVTYTPLNGTGYKLVPEILRRTGVSKIDVVPEQAAPDGNFPTCPYPNPEKAEALRLGLERAEKNGSDILIATDPDCDRAGIAVRHEGEYRLLTGNQVGVLLTDFLFSTKAANGTLPSRPVLVKTIVTTALAAKVAERYNAEVFDVLTGFKYIGDVIAKLERKGEQNRFILGFEESYGYLSGTYVRDKDAVNASMLIAEMTAHYKKAGKTLVDRLEEIYEVFGVYEHKTVTFAFEGLDGADKMKAILDGMRNNRHAEIAGEKVVKFVDYLTQTEFDLPRSNVLSFVMADGSQLIVRPSGTEPLIKVYLTACRDRKANAVKFEAMLSELKTVFGK